MRFVDAGCFSSAFLARLGRGISFPPQFGQILSTQFVQNVHSKEQIMAPTLSAARSVSHISQLGRISSITYLSFEVLQRNYQ